jgi:hypothetical protein
MASIVIMERCPHAKLLSGNKEFKYFNAQNQGK